ncbi:hypothetical protein N657DRAFT_129420 [Parathielavia appendiculata]|uniref:Uncharacterized protein n=1 Tax=Parathielavia appendiculata TaxID=2587402 RepID=A0AAN6TVU1_9PEZI|nr:hypothetical protein N657DRAFT_129420 [Parathielavia appendiculata]
MQKRSPKWRIVQKCAHRQRAFGSVASLQRTWASDLLRISVADPGPRVQDLWEALLWFRSGPACSMCWRCLMGAGQLRLESGFSDAATYSLGNGGAEQMEDRARRGSQAVKLETQGQCRCSVLWVSNRAERRECVGHREKPSRRTPPKLENQTSTSLAGFWQTGRLGWRFVDIQLSVSRQDQKVALARVVRSGRDEQGMRVPRANPTISPPRSKFMVSTFQAVKQKKMEHKYIRS